MSEEQKQALIDWLKEGIELREEYGFNGNLLASMRVALAALTAPPDDWKQRAEAAEAKQESVDWPDCGNAEMGSYDGCVTVITPTGKLAGIDACLVSEVCGLWAKGITTYESCCGHNVAHSYIAVAEENIKEMLMMGYIPDEWTDAPGIFLSKTSKHGATSQHASSPVPAADLAELVPDAPTGHKCPEHILDPFSWACGAEWFRAAILRNIEEAK